MSRPRKNPWAWHGSKSWRDDHESYVDSPPMRLDKLVLVECDPYLSSAAPERDHELYGKTKGMAWIGPTETPAERWLRERRERIR